MNLFDIIVIIILIINIFWILILFKTILKQASIIYETIHYIKSYCEEEDGTIVGYGDDLSPIELLKILEGDEKNE